MPVYVSPSKRHTFLIVERTTQLIFLLTLIIACAGDAAQKDDQQDDSLEGEDAWWFQEKGKPHPCSRRCESEDQRSCYYKFKVEWYYSMSKACYDCPNTIADCLREDCVAADGVARPIMVVNKQLPGPSIEVCLGDKVIVDLECNMNDQSCSIHWHGHHQVQSPYMDGVPYVTQCPIPPNSMFRYIMNATNSGTQFWHAHTGVQRGDGVFGPLIVRTTQYHNSYHDFYHHDLSEHVIAINDWTHVSSMDKFLWHVQGTGNNKPDTILVNGKGRYFDDSVAQTNTPLAVFTVKQGFRYRFRLINSGVHNCPEELYIDGHKIIAIASDGYDFDHVTVDSLVSYAGERWDFVLDANQTVGNYWMRFTGLMDCGADFTKAHQLAVLHYEGAPDEEPSAPVGYNVHPKPKLQLNPLNEPINTPGTLFVPNLFNNNRTDDPCLVHKEPDHRFYLSYDFNAVDHPMYHKHDLYGFDQVNTTFRRYTPQFNFISFKWPHSPLLTQHGDVDANLFCDHQDTSHCDRRFCECTYVIQIPLNSKVELILIDKGVTFNANHPFHLHGYAFRVVGMNRVSESLSEETVRRMDAEGLLIRNLQNPPFKDTVTVPDGGYTILRFHAQNPGYWLFHCHIEFHLEVGMAVVFKIGNDTDLPRAPTNFPKCGNFFNN